MKTVVKGMDDLKAKFIDDFGEILVIYDKEYRHLYVNEATALAARVPVAEMLGKSNRELGIPSDVNEVLRRENKIDEVFLKKCPTEYITHHQFPNGDVEYFHTKFYPEIDELNEVQVVYALTRNITNQVRLEENYKKSLEKLEIKNVELDSTNKHLNNFVHVIAHDLKNPLNNIDQLMDHYEKAQQVDKNKYYDLIKSSFGRLRHTILSLIDIVVAGNTDEKLFKNIAIKQVFDSVLEDFKESIKKLDGKVYTNFEIENIYYVEGYLDSIIRNLLSNAIKYSHSGRLLKIELSIEQQGSYALLIIKDNGIEIDLKKNGDKMFLPFKRFTNKAEGRGIGLSIIKTMVERNGGKIEVESEEGNGTSFRIYIPIIQNY